MAAFAMNINRNKKQKDREAAEYKIKLHPGRKEKN